MKQLIWIIILFLCAVGLALAAHTYTGNVYIVIEHYMLRVNLHLFILGLVAAVFVMYVLMKVLFGVLGTPGKLSRFGAGRRRRKAAHELNLAGLAFFEGKYQEAEQHAAKVLKNGEAGDDNRMLALMLAAHAADGSGNVEQRNQYLDDIAKLPEKVQLSRYLLLAETALNQQDYATADNHLKSAAQINPRLTRLVRLQLRMALDKKDALDILDKANKLRLAGGINASELQQTTEQAYRDLLAMAKDQAGMKACLKRIPEGERNTVLDVAIANKYVELGLYEQAVAWVNKHYPTRHDAALLQPFVNSVSYLDERSQQKAIDTADGWLKNNPQDACLLRCLGELASNRELWGKAQGYLEASMAIEPAVRTRLLLATVLECSNRSNDAQEQRRLALAEMECAEQAE
ncbi:heme biosynthesis HemY N-terminal domain-containing protein [Kingella negevensis]|uniref:heme biosynthesis HemY N-terminal domain-containing protein n=1 Tax=Kingella negevensis TaxID=1522312 RepID=UPI00050A24D8|nr:heme biosynthesis HemY N-terminal domain-containing protein [Kingella negevensis]MDK4687740.1 heme biosynthesis HemY N-terminal domain-containing protein [Kingella negevensis]WII91265.1 heme biosynthesis HemY N-terminal domain-containing protein [Kingella negevensis]WII92888.1 heme biosynthesis HemY N-terminal domain-containing protein [Kingella negevensis]